MLMSAHDRAVDHGVFIVGVRGQVLEKTLPYSRFRPASVTAVHILPVAEPLRQVTPRHARSVAKQHRFDEPPIVPGRHSNMANPARKKVTDALPLIIAKTVTSHRSAPNWLIPYESSFPPIRNPLNDDML
jgi:hypothetical protein